MELLQGTLSPCERFQLSSQHEACAFASLVVASLPFPPLPVVVLQGGEDGMGSSFDLLQQAIAVQQTGCAPGGDLVQRKKEMLERLRVDITAHYEKGIAVGDMSICSDEWVAGAYDIYCRSFRDYLLCNYAVCTADLRFHPLDSVPDDGVLVLQGSSHWKAGRMLAGEPESSGCFKSYKQMLRSYAVDLGTLPV